MTPLYHIVLFGLGWKFGVGSVLSCFHSRLLFHHSSSMPSLIPPQTRFPLIPCQQASRCLAATYTVREKPTLSALAVVYRCFVCRAHRGRDQAGISRDVSWGHVVSY
ncbi:hypothetical protein F4801DRAFT_561034 [Xylaria longipes]|nr:hypothetical protein F4801DRAFT_561034 [Xylaria longipes]